MSRFLTGTRPEISVSEPRGSGTWLSFDCREGSLRFPESGDFLNLRQFTIGFISHIAISFTLVTSHRDYKPLLANLAVLYGISQIIDVSAGIGL